MKAKTLFFGGVLFVGLLLGCEQQSLEEEVDDVCSCIQQAETEAEFEKCYDQMEKVSDKYAFDPEAAEEIKKRLRECATN